MPRDEESFGSSTIRLDGGFNPAIVSADWLLAKGLIDEADRDFALENRFIMTPAFSGSRYPWIVVEVTRESLHLSATDETETPERLREFAVGLLTALPETPVHALSTTHFWHIATGEARWREIAEALAPPEPWKAIAPDSELDTLTRQVSHEDSDLEISVQSSVRSGYEMYVEVERYWGFGDPPGEDPRGAVAALDEHWTSTVQAADEIRDSILKVR